MNIDFNQVRKFFKSPLGALVGFILIVVIGLLFIKQRQPSNPVSANPDPTVVAPASTSVTEFTSSTPEVRPLPAMPQRPAISQVFERETPPPPLPIDLYTSKELPIGSISAPYGRLIRCELVNTVDSSKIETPIIGIVTSDVLNPGGNGEVVIPAGAEVHGFAQVDRSRERIGTQKEWTIVWTDGSGRELALTGIGCDQAKDPNSDTWRVSDGSAGFKGELIKTDNWAELKLFAATALSGIASGLTNSQTSSNALGGITTTSVGSLQNGITSGAQAVVNQYAQQVLERIRQDGFFVRVPAGYTFYLYVTQTIDQSQAVVAGSTVNELATQKQAFHSNPVIRNQ